MGEVTLTRGWKGYLGGVLLVLVGLYLLTLGEDVAAVQSIAMGLGILGIRHYLAYSQE